MAPRTYKKCSITIPKPLLKFGQTVLAREAVRTGETPNFSAAVRMLIARELERRNAAQK